MSESIDYKGHTITVSQDHDPMNPHEWDNLGTLALKNSGWADEDIDDQESFFKLLLEEEEFRPWSREYQEWDYYDIDTAKAQRNIEAKYIVLPVYKYEQSGVCYNTSGFSCPWDSGQNGFIYVSKEDVRKEYSVKRISKKIHDKVIKQLECEVQTFSDAVSGNVWGYEITDENGDDLDSCWGFIGDAYSQDDYIWQEARSVVDHQVKRNRKKRIARLKEMILNKVPLFVREQELQPYQLCPTS